MTDLKFVQPIVTTPNIGVQYWYFDTSKAKPDWFYWNNDALDNNLFDAGLIYTNPDDCVRRNQYIAVQLRK